MQPIRTISEISAHTDILPAIQIPLCKTLSAKVKQLRTLEMSYENTAGELNPSKPAIIRGHRFYNDKEKN